MKVWEPASNQWNEFGKSLCSFSHLEGLATAIVSSPELTQVLVRLAKGGVGLIITSHTTIKPGRTSGVRQAGIWSDDFIPKLP